MNALNLQGEQGETQDGYDRADAKVLDEVGLAGHVDGARNVDGEIEETHLEGDQVFQAIWPVLGVLDGTQHVSTDTDTGTGTSRRDSCNRCNRCNDSLPVGKYREA